MSNRLRYIYLIITLCWFNALASAQALNDSTLNVTLNEVVVRADNISRVDDHLLIIPTAEQIKHSDNGFSLLNSLMLPGLEANKSTGIVSSMGLTATLYINGQPCDYRDIAMIRPKDVQKIEYFDSPKGKYSNDVLAINFVMKKYTYGGYVQADGTEYIGFTAGDYNIATSLSNKNLTYSLFAGVNFSNISDINTCQSELYVLPERSVNRDIFTSSKTKQRNEYAQLRIQYQQNNKYFVSKFALINSTEPKSNSIGTIYENGNSHSSLTNTSSHNLSPSIDLNGQFPISENKYISFNAHGQYSRNKYTRSYTEDLFDSNIQEKEDAALINGSIIFNSYGTKSTFTAQIMEYYRLFDATYIGNSGIKQNLWKSSTLAFIGYNYNFSNKTSFQSRIGVDWNQYHLSGTQKISYLNPRVNLTLRQQIKNGMLMWSFMLANSNYGSDVINTASIQINPYLVRVGNPSLKRTHDINTYLYYSGQFNKLKITAIGQYLYTYHPVSSSYYQGDNEIINSYTTNGWNNYLSLIGAATYSFTNKLSISGDIRYSYTKLSQFIATHSNDITGNINLQWYLGNFALNPGVNFRTKKIDTYSLVETTTPINYTLRMSYSYKNLLASLFVQSPFNKRTLKHHLDAEVYKMQSNISDPSFGQFCALSLSYSFDYGRKTKRIEKDVDSSINSSLLKAN